MKSRPLRSSSGERAPIAGWVVAATLVLMIPAIVNGAPFIYYDTATYLSAPQPVLPILKFLLEPLTLRSGGVLENLHAVRVRYRILSSADPVAADWIMHRGRAPHYRILGALSVEYGRVWSLAALQALLTALVAALFWARVAGLALGWGWLAGMAALTALTPLGLFAGLAMPDILSGVTVLAVIGLVLGWTRLRVSERAALAVIAGFAMLSHQTHLLLGAGLALALALLARHTAGRYRGLAAVLAAAFTAGALEQGYMQLLDLRPDATVQSRPHLVAHLIDHGPGVDYLRQNCPEAGFALCAHVDKLPMRWSAFLFGGRSAESRFLAEAPVAERVTISQEQFPLVLAIIRDDPWGVLGFALRAAGRQITMFRPDGAIIMPDNLAPHPVPFPPDLKQATWDSRLYADPGLLRTLGDISGVVVVGALALLLLGWLRLWVRQGGADRYHATMIVTALMAGLLLNAIICGVLASPYDRFQARLIWLLPYAALMLTVAAFGTATQTARHGARND